MCKKRIYWGDVGGRTLNQHYPFCDDCWLKENTPTPDPGVLVRVGDEVVTASGAKTIVRGETDKGSIVCVIVGHEYAQSIYPDKLTFNGRPVRGFQAGYTADDLQDAWRHGHYDAKYNTYGTPHEVIAEIDGRRDQEANRT